MRDQVLAIRQQISHGHESSGGEPTQRHLCLICRYLCVGYGDISRLRCSLTPGLCPFARTAAVKCRFQWAALASRGHDVAGLRLGPYALPPSERRTYCMMPPCRKYSASPGVSIRTTARNFLPSARTVTSRGVGPEFIASMPRMSNTSWPVSNSDSALSPGLNCSG